MPSSIRSGQRAAVRRAEVAPQSLGLEEELSFGSDEDLMETIGEIDLPAEPPSKDLAALKTTQMNASTNSLKRPGKVSKASTLSLRSHKSKTNDASLSTSTHLLPPLPPVPSGSTLDLPSDMFGNAQDPETASTGSRKHKRGSLMGTFKSVRGLRKWRDDHSGKTSFFSNESQTSTLSLSKMGSNTSSRPSLGSSYAQTPVSPAYSAPQLAHLNLSHISFDQSPSKSLSSNGHLPDLYSKQQQQPRYEPSLGNSSVTTDSSVPVETPPVSVPKVRASSSWYRSELSSAILPDFPATSSQLQPITVLAVPASFRQITPGYNGLRHSRWTPCTLVFTIFKMAIDEKPRGTGDEHSVAHIHVLSSNSSPRGLANSTTSHSIGSLRRPSKNSGPAFVADPTSVQEIDRRLLSRYSSAEITSAYAHSEGRDLALRIMFGDSVDGNKGSGEWLLEIKDMSQLEECVNQIKKTAIMINAEELGYGRAIRDAFDTPSVSANELAHKLSVHARAVAARRERQRIPEAPEPPTEAMSKIKLQSSPKSSASQEMARRDSYDVAASAAISRSRSAEDVRSTPASSVSPLPVIEDSYPEPREEPSRLSFGSTSGFALASAMAFPAPPSDLPPRRSRPLPPNPTVSIVSPSGGHMDDEDSGTATPLGRPPTPPRGRSGSMSSSKRTLTVHDSAGAPSLNSENSGSTTNRLRRLRGKPQVVDIMAEFSAFEAEQMPPEEEEELVRDDRARRIRFAGE